MSNSTINSERERVGAIHSLASKYNLPADQVQRAVDSGEPVSVLQSYILNNPHGHQPPVATRNLDASQPLGLSQRDASSYSIRDAINEFASDGRVTGQARELSDEVARQTGKQAQGFYVPLADLSGTSRSVNRAMLAGNALAAGNTVQTDVLGSSMIEQLRNRLVLEALGVRRLTDLKGDVSIPKQTAGATAYWLAEGETVLGSEQTFGQLNLTPKRVVSNTAYSKQLLAQSSLDAEFFVRDDLMKAIATAIDLAGISGSGVGAEPKGILKTTGIGSVTFGGAPDWAKVVNFETQVSADNADSGSLAYLTSAAVRGKFKSTEKSTGSGHYIWGENQTVNGYAAAVSNQIPENKVLFGNWADAFYAIWQGMDVIVDPYTLKKAGLIEICVSQLVDFGVRHPQSFCVSTDSGAQ
jgi:HK97 family phage major capsid protein